MPTRRQVVRGARPGKRSERGVGCHDFVRRAARPNFFSQSVTVYGEKIEAGSTSSETGTTHVVFDILLLCSFFFADTFRTLFFALLLVLLIIRA